MKETLKNIYDLYKELPETLLFLILFIKTFFQKSNVEFKDKRKDKINVLGNGPSGIRTYIDNRFEEDKLMCVNYFALTNFFLEFKPEYYTLIDKVFFLEENEKNLKLIEVFNNVTWNMRILTPAKYADILKNKIKNGNIEIYAIRFNYLPGKNKFVHSLYSKNLAIPKFQNVVVACLYSSINLGFSTIKLHGVEASEFTNFTINEKNEALLHTEHSYGNSTINMFKDGRIKKGEFWKFLIYYAYMLKGFSQIESYSKHMNSKIYNYTKDSYIDSFEKI